MSDFLQFPNLSRIYQNDPFAINNLLNPKQYVLEDGDSTNLHDVFLWSESKEIENGQEIKKHGLWKALGAKKIEDDVETGVLESFLSRYLKTIRFASKNAVDIVDDQTLTSQKRMQALVWLLRYSLIEASVASQAQKMSGVLMQALLQAGVWDADQAVLFASGIQDEDRRIETISAISDLLADEASEKIYEITFKNPHTKSALYGKAIRRDDQRNKVIFSCLALLKDPDSRGSGIVSIQSLSQRTLKDGSPYLSASHCKTILESISGYWSRDHVRALLLALIPSMNKDDLKICWSRAKESYFDGHEIGEIGVEIVARTAMLQGPDTALETAKELRLINPWHEASLARILRFADHSSKKQIEELISKGVTERKWLLPKSDDEWQPVLGSPEPGAKEILLLRAMPLNALVYILAAFAPDSDLFSQAAWNILDSWEPRDGEWIIPKISRFLSEDQREVFFSKALKVLSADQNARIFSSHRKTGLLALVNAFPLSLLPQTLNVAFGMLDATESWAGQLKEDVHIPYNLPLSTGKLTAGDFIEYISHGMDFEDDEEVIQIILAIFNRDKENLLLKVLQKLKSIKNAQARLDAVSQLSPHLPHEDYEWCLDLARNFIGGFKDRQNDSKALAISATAIARLSYQANKNEKPLLVNEAIETARKIGALSLSALGTSLTEITNLVVETSSEGKIFLDFHRDWLLEALNANRLIQDEFEQAQALVELIPFASPTFQKQNIRDLLTLINKNGVFPRRDKSSLADNAVQEDREDVLIKLIPILSTHSFHAEITSLKADLHMMDDEKVQLVKPFYDRAVEQSSAENIIKRARHLLSHPQDAKSSPVEQVTSYKTVDSDEEIDFLRNMFQSLAGYSRKKSYKQIKELTENLFAIGGSKFIDQVYEAILKTGEWWV